MELSVFIRFFCQFLNLGKNHLVSHIFRFSRETVQLRAAGEGHRWKGKRGRKEKLMWEIKPPSVH